MRQSVPRYSYLWSKYARIKLKMVIQDSVWYMWWGHTIWSHCMYIKTYLLKIEIHKCLKYQLLALGITYNILIDYIDMIVLDRNSIVDEYFFISHWSVHWNEINIVLRLPAGWSIQSILDHVQHHHISLIQANAYV